MNINKFKNTHLDVLVTKRRNFKNFTTQNILTNFSKTKVIHVGASGVESMKI